MAELKQSLHFTFRAEDDPEDDPGGEGQLSPCHEWVRPWAERNPEHLEFNSLAREYVNAILNPPPPPPPLPAGGYETDPNIEPGVYTWVFGIPEEAQNPVEKGELRLVLITRGGNTVTRQETTGRGIVDRLDVHFAPPRGPGNGNLVCPLVPYGVFVNSIYTDLTPEPIPLSERLNEIGAIGAGAMDAEPWYRVELDQYDYVTAELDMRLIKVSTDLMDDRLPDSRIDKPRITADLIFVWPTSLPGYSAYKGPNGVTEGSSSYVSRNLYDYDNTQTGEVRLTLASSSLSTSDPASYYENVWPGHMIGTSYTVDIADGNQLIRRVHGTQGGATTGIVTPAWELYEQDQVPDVEVYYSLGPAYGVRVQWAAPIYHWLQAPMPEDVAPVVANYSAFSQRPRLRVLHWSDSDLIKTGDLNYVSWSPYIEIKKETKTGTVRQQGSVSVTPVNEDGQRHIADFSLNLPFSALDATYPQAKAEIVWDGEFPQTPVSPTYTATFKSEDGKTLRNVFHGTPPSRHVGAPEWGEMRQLPEYADVRYATAKAPYWGVKVELFGAGSLIALLPGGEKQAIVGDLSGAINLLYQPLVQIQVVELYKNSNGVWIHGWRTAYGDFPSAGTGYAGMYYLGAAP